MKNNWICFTLAMFIFVGIQNACLFTRTNLWLAQFVVVKQNQIRKMLEEQRLKQEKKLKEKAEKEKVKLWDKQVKDFTGLLAHLEEAKQEQNLRKKQLDDLELQLKNEREALNVLKQSIEILQAEFEKRVITVEEAEIKNLKILAESYSNMTPESVAKIFAESEESSIIKIMHFLAPETLGAILQVMSKDIAKDKENGAKINHLLECFRLSEEVKK